MPNKILIKLQAHHLCHAGPLWVCPRIQPAIAARFKASLGTMSIRDWPFRAASPFTQAYTSKIEEPHGTRHKARQVPASPCLSRLLRPNTLIPVVRIRACSQVQRQICARHHLALDTHTGIQSLSQRKTIHSFTKEGLF